MQQVEHEGADPLAVLHRRCHPIGESRTRLAATGRTAAAMGAVFGDDQRSRFGQIDDLTGNEAGRHRLGQPTAATGTVRRIVVNDRVGRLGATQRLSLMALLPAGLLAGPFPQTADPHRLLQSVAGWRLAAVAAVQTQPALQLGNARLHRRHLSCVTRLLRQQQGDEVGLRQLLKGGALHRILGIGPPRSCQPKPCSSPSSRRTTESQDHHVPGTDHPGLAATWAVTSCESAQRGGVREGVH